MFRADKYNPKRLLSSRAHSEFPYHKHAPTQLKWPKNRALEFCMALRSRHGHHNGVDDLLKPKPLTLKP